MIKALGIAAIVLVVAVAAIAIYASTMPDTFRVQRSLLVNAPPEKIYPLIQDFHSWRAWSPYEERDPNLKRTFSGPNAGHGAVYEWSGNKNIGSGRMEIIEATPTNKIGIKLDFFSPFEAHNTAEFTMQKQGGATNVTWDMHGPAQFIGKVMGVFINMDKMVGTDFEKGLQNLKAAAER